MIARSSPPPPDLGTDATTLAVIAAAHCWMPHPDVVTACAGAVFPTIRASNIAPRLTIATVDGRRLMYDDNMTPRWAFLWAHGIAGTGHPKGWTFAHVWGDARDPDAYTNPANLVLMPEALASLSDKVGPLCGFRRNHAQTVYGWTPKGAAATAEPDGYPGAAWRYLAPYPDPKAFIAARMASINNERVRILRSLSDEAGTLHDP